MSVFFKEVMGDKIVWWGMLSSICLLLLCVVYVLFVYQNIPPFIPLYHQMPWGEEKLGTRLEIFLPIGIGIAFLITNFLFSTFSYHNMPLVSRMLSITSMLVSITIVIFILRTTQLIL